MFYSQGKDVKKQMKMVTLTWCFMKNKITFILLLCLLLSCTVDSVEGDEVQVKN